MWNVLLIDDEEVMHFLNSQLIERAGFSTSIQTSYSGVEALELIESGSYKTDIIFLDISMPEMNGLEFLASFIKLEKEFTEGIYIVMLTSSLDQEEREEAKSYDCVIDFFNKPLDFNKLQRLDEQLKGL